MNAIVLGVRRQGKSTLSYWIARQKHDTVIVFDPNAQFRHFHTVDSAQGIADWLESHDRKGTIVMRPRVGEFDADFDELGEVLIDRDAARFRYDNFSLIIDEASCLQKSWGMNATLEWIIRRAPESIYVVQNAHKMTDIHSVSWTSGPDIFFFHSILARDLKAIELQCGPEVAEAVKKLGKYQLVHCWLEDGGQRKWVLWDTPDMWYVGLERPANAGHAA